MGVRGELCGVGGDRAQKLIVIQFMDYPMILQILVNVKEKGAFWWGSGAFRGRNRQKTTGGFVGYDKGFADARVQKWQKSVEICYKKQRKRMNFDTERTMQRETKGL